MNFLKKVRETKMIKGIGIDLIELRRIEQAVKRNGRFIERILTVKEIKLYEELEKEQRKLEFLAGRFSAKEAFSKATGTGIGKLSFKDIEILRADTGAPYVNVAGYDSRKIFISITHSEDYAVSQVIITA